MGWSYNLQAPIIKHLKSVYYRPMMVRTKCFWRVLGSLLLAAFIIPCQAQTSLPSISKKLTAADFKGKPDPGSNYLATTFTHLTYQYRHPTPCSGNDKIKFQFETGITVGDKSWMKFDRIKTSRLLQILLDHEQGHYDIATALADKLQKTLTATCFSRNGYAQQIDSVYKTVSKYYDTLQVNYDAETGHGLDPEVQTIWKAKIAALR